MQNRRQYNRWEINKPIRIRLEGAVKDIPCTLRDINFQGMQVALRNKLAQDAFIRLTVVLSDEDFFNAEAWVVWRKTVESRHIYGVYFNRLSEQARAAIFKFLRELFPSGVIKELNKDFSHGTSHGNSHGNSHGKKEGGEKMDDRRIFQRFNIRFPVRFLNLSTGQEGEAQTVDVSAKGIGLSSNMQISPNSLIEMWLKVPDKGEPLYTRGEVAWANCARENECRAGVNLERADLMGISRILRTI